MLFLGLLVDKLDYIYMHSFISIDLNKAIN